MAWFKLPFGYADMRRALGDRGAKCAVGTMVVLICLILAAIIYYIVTQANRPPVTINVGAIKPKEEAIKSCDAKLEKITEGHGSFPDGRRLISRVYRVVPGSGPPVMKLTFKAQGGGVSDLKIKSRDPKRFEVFEEVIISGGKAEAVQNPRGMYEVTVIGKDPDDTRLDSILECE